MAMAMADSAAVVAVVVVVVVVVVGQKLRRGVAGMES